MHRGERRFALEERCRFISTERRVNLFDILTAKSKRLKAIELKAKKVLIDDFDPRCIPEHYQRVSGVSDGADTPSENTTSEEAASSWIPPPQFADIDSGNVRLIRRMSLDRLDHLKRLNTPDREEDPPVISAVGIHAQKLVRLLAEVQLLHTMMNLRPNTVRKGYSTTTQLQKSLVAEKVNASKTMRKLNSALAEQTSPSRGVITPELDIKNLYTEETAKRVEQWAHEANPSPESLPWWANPSTAATIDAYEDLNRVAEERSRIAAERASALAWVERRLLELRAAPEHTVYAEAIEGIEHLRQHWTGDIDLSDALLPDDPMTAAHALHATPDDADATSMEVEDV